MAGAATFPLLAVKPPPATISAGRSRPEAAAFFPTSCTVYVPPGLTSRPSNRGRVKAEGFRSLAVTGDGEWSVSTDGGAVAVAVAEAEEEGRDANAGDLKKKLKELLHGTDRGLKASCETRAEIMELINQLEAKNPNPAPTEALHILNGKWILAYTSFSQLFPLLGSDALACVVRVEEISQTIDSEAFTVQNSIQFASPFATTSLTTNAKFEIRSPKRVQIKFEEGVISTPQLTDSIVIPEKLEFLGQNFDLPPLKGIFTSIQDAASSVAKKISGQPPLKIPLSKSHAQSWLLTTYLDEELRISRGDGSSVFVLVKEGSLLLD